MENIQAIMKYLWLLNAEVNSLNEPKMLAEECINNISELKSLNLSSNEIEIFQKELKNSGEYLADIRERLEELELQINKIVDGWNRG
ncbi:MAG: hypothetical protein VB106_02995 [Clostridiaceae bacterium]|nr:hypothetical protein [Clostridiaceae bacterium]